MIVVDAAAAFDYLVDAGPRGVWAREVLEVEPELAAPHLVDVEVVSALRRRIQRNELSSARSAAALEDLRLMPFVRYPVNELLDRIWAVRAALTPYDAAYVALAEALDVRLVTTDDRLARSRGHRAAIASPTT